MTLQEIKDLIYKGNRALALKHLERFLKTNKLSNQDRFVVAGIYRSLGKNERALKIIGREYTLPEMMVASEDVILLQIRLAHLLNVIGAKYAAKRIYNNTFEVEKARSLELRKLSPFLDYHLCGHYLNMGDVKKAENYAENFLEYGPKQDVNFHAYFCECMARVQNDKGNFDESLVLLDKLLQNTNEENNMWKIIGYTRRGETHLFNNNLKEAAKDFAQTTRLISPDNSAEFSFLKRCQAYLAILEGSLNEAGKIIQDGINITREKTLSPDFLISFYYLMTLVDPEKLSLAQYISLRCHIMYSEYSFLSGRKWVQGHSKPLSYIVQKLYKDHENDSWIVVDDKMQSVQYSDWMAKNKSFIKAAGFIDLVAGSMQINGHMIHLSTLEWKLLYAVIGSGDVGVSKWTLIDFVYRENFYNVSQGEERISKLITSLRKKHIDIKLDKGLYYFWPHPIPLLIIPMDSSFYHPTKPLKALIPNFQRTDVEMLYKIKPSTAKSWIKEWSEAKIISPDPNRKNFWTA